MTNGLVRVMEFGCVDEAGAIDVIILHCIVGYTRGLGTVVYLCLFTHVINIVTIALTTRSFQVFYKHQLVTISIVLVQSGWLGG